MEHFLAILPFVILVVWDRWLEPRQTEAARDARRKKLEDYYRLKD